MGNSIVYYVGAAFLGGVILNVMPCVLPVLTMKVFHVIEKAKEDPSVNRRHGLAYSAGIMLTFWIFAAIVIGLRVSGERMGWGMQFQNPTFVAVMTALIFGFGLNALGVFEFTVGMGEVGGGEGYRGSFVNGMVASIMATPCSAPFLGSAAAFALGAQAAWWHTALIFTFIGVGLAFPFLLVSYVPALGQRLPRPGAWMETFKQLMGFTLLGASVWLFGVLQAQLSASASNWYLAFLLVLAMALWGQQHFGGLEHSNLRRRGVQLACVGLTLFAGWRMLDLSPAKKKQTMLATAPAQTPDSSTGGPLAGEPPLVVDGKINWRPFDPKTVKANLDRNRPVFMDYTADWCANCKTNEKLFIETEAIRDKLEATKILPMKADFTNEDEVIEEWMEKLKRSGIPIYVIYMPDGSYELLPEVITTEMLSTALDKVSKKYPPTKFAALSGGGGTGSDAPAKAKSAPKDQPADGTEEAPKNEAPADETPEKQAANAKG